MKTRILLILGFSLATLHAADPAPADLLRQGLFEEEANQNLDKAAEHYRAVIAANERQRGLAASATFRLGEIARKKDDTEAATAAFRTLLERYPEQQELARLSRENLAALGVKTAAPALAAPAAAIADAEEAEIARLKEIARNSPDLIDSAGSDGWRPLHHAAAKGQTRVIAYLLENRADPDGTTVTERISPLQLAALYGHLGAVKSLLTAKADPNLTFRVSNLFGGSFPPTGVEKDRLTGDWTALDLAILYNRRETALALIHAGTDLQRNERRLSPRRGEVNGITFTLNTLELAIYFQRNEIAQAMIDAGFPLATREKNRESTPLTVALSRNPQMVAPLIQAGADVNLAIRDGVTPLHRAWTIEMADLLLSKGAELNAQDSAGLTPLQYVAKHYPTGPSVALLEFLLKKGATVADPIALLQQAHPTMVKAVREQVTYPTVQRRDAVFVSSSGYPIQRKDKPMLLADLFAFETRISPQAPAPSLAETMCAVFRSDSHPESIRILRRAATTQFACVHEWITAKGATLPTDWPALEWGDIVEVNYVDPRIDTTLRSGEKVVFPSIADFAALIPTRAVTVRLGDLEIPTKITGGDAFWLNADSIKKFTDLIPRLENLADTHRVVINREGLPEPITLDFTKPTETGLRLLDGDTLEMSWDVAKMNDPFFKKELVNAISLGESRIFGVRDNSLKWFLSTLSPDGSFGFSKICILRRAENWKPEMVDIKAWQEATPRQRETEEIFKPEPKMNQGDLVVVVAKQDANAQAPTALPALPSVGQPTPAPRPTRDTPIVPPAPVLPPREEPSQPAQWGVPVR